MLETFGIAAAEERVYRALLRAPGARAATVAERAGVTPHRVQVALHRLVELRLAERRPGRPATYLATPPDIAIAALVNERAADLDRARLAVPELLADYRAGTATAEPSGLLEVLTGAGVAANRTRELEAAATAELLVFDRVEPGEPAGGPDPGWESALVERGVRRRGVYDLSALALPDRLSRIRRIAALGGQVRATPRLPMMMVICDRRVALLPLVVGPGAVTERVLLVHPSSLLDSLVDLFEFYWPRSVPIRPAGDVPSWSEAGAQTGQDLPAQARQVLDLLALGLPDGAIARQLGASMRTTRRRVAGLLDELGVRTRFQAGVEAARRGLL